MYLCGRRRWPASTDLGPVVHTCLFCKDYRSLSKERNRSLQAKSDWAPVLYGVPQALLSSLYINDISTDNSLRMTVCYREIKGTEDILKLQKYKDQLGCCARKWGMRFQPAKCNMSDANSKETDQNDSLFIHSGGNGPRKCQKCQSKKSNDQELIQSDRTSCPQNQKGNN